jgi:serine/threonine protein kinase
MIAVESRAPQVEGTLEPGAMLGSYRLVARLAAGLTTEVWQAKITGAQGFEKAIALKMLRPEAALSTDAVRSFTTEAAIAAKLYHPNIVQLVDFERAGGRYFIAMEYVPGCTLRALVERLRSSGQPLPLAFLAHIFQQVCAGLHYAHELTERDQWLGILHRDVTPENLIFAPSGAVKVIDFGSARMGTTASAPRSRGLRYVAPERVLGLPEDCRADVYSVGAVLYECLTGVPPFGTDDSALDARIVAGHVLDPRALAGELPDEIVRITLHALATSPEDRPASAEELASELTAFEESCYDGSRPQRPLADQETPIVLPALGALGDDITHPRAGEPPMSAKSERINEVLRGLRAGSPEIVGACVVSAEGFMLASVMPAEIEQDRIGGMAVTLLAAGEHMAMELMRAQMEQVYVRTSNGYVIVNAVGANASLVLLVTREAKLGLIFLELKRTLVELGKYIS